MNVKIPVNPKCVEARGVGDGVSLAVLLNGHWYEGPRMFKRWDIHEALSKVENIRGLPVSLVVELPGAEPVVQPRADDLRLKTLLASYRQDGTEGEFSLQSPMHLDLQIAQHMQDTDRARLLQAFQSRDPVEILVVSPGARSEVDRLTSELAEARALLAKAHAEADEAIRQRDSHRREREAAEQHALGLVREKAGLKTDLEGVRKDLDAAIARVKVLTYGKDLLEEELKTQRERYSQSMAADPLMQRVALLEAERNEAVATETQLRQSLATANETNAKLAGQVQSLEVSLRSEGAELAKTRCEYQSAIEEVRKTLAIMTDRAHKAEEALRVEKAACNEQARLRIEEASACNVAEKKCDELIRQRDTERALALTYLRTTNEQAEKVMQQNRLLKRYVKHDSSCPFETGVSGVDDCTCGLIKAMG